MLEIRFFATLRQGRGNSVKIDYTEGVTGGELLNFFNISKNDVSIFLVNGFHTPLEQKIEDSSIISIFPPVGGG